MDPNQRDDLIRNGMSQAGISLHQPGAKPRFGRLYHPDPRDKDFRMLRALPKRIPSGSKYWRAGPLLDQGQTSRCTGYSTITALNSGPHMHNFSGEQADMLYFEAQRNDEWEGEDYEGSSVRGAMKAAVKQGYLGDDAAYVWAGSLSEVIGFVMLRGCVVMGTDWYSGMMNTDAKGFIHCMGSVEGGHAWAITGVSQYYKKFRMKNTWGVWGWENSGSAWISFEDLEFLLVMANGECASFVEKTGLKG